jgi:hypothetical protein
VGRASRKKRDRSSQPPRSAGAQFQDAVREVEAADHADLARRLEGLMRLAPAARILLVHLVSPPSRHSCLVCLDSTRTLSVWAPTERCQDWGVPHDVAVFALIPLCDVCESLYNSGAAPWPEAVEADIQAAVTAELRREGVI